MRRLFGMIAGCMLVPSIAAADAYVCTMTSKIGRDMVPDTVYVTLDEARGLGTVRDAMTEQLSDTAFPAEVTQLAQDRWHFRWELAGISGKWGNARLSSAHLNHTLRLNTSRNSFIYESSLIDFGTVTAGSGACTKT